MIFTSFTVVELGSIVGLICCYFAWQKLLKMRQEPAWSDLRAVNSRLSVAQRSETRQAVAKGNAVVHPELADAALVRAKFVQSLGRDYSRFLRGALLIGSLFEGVLLAAGLLPLLPTWVNLMFIVPVLLAGLTWNLWFPRAMNRSKEQARRAEEANRALLGGAHRQ